MADLIDEELAREFAISYPGGDIRRMVLELQRRRTEQAAGREHVERVVKEEVADALTTLPIRLHITRDLYVEGAASAIARRVAARLSAPVLSTEEVALLEWSKKEHEVYVESAKYQKRSQTGVANARQAIALLERLIGGTRP